MPASRVTSQSPWHVVFVIDDSGSMADPNAPGGVPYQHVNDSLRALVAELAMLSQGGAKPYFKASVVKFGDRARAIEEAGSPADWDGRIDQIAQFSGSSGTTNLADALDEAGRVLQRNPGSSTDFEPWVFVFSDGLPNDASAAQSASQRLRGLSVAAGTPKVYACGFGDADDSLLRSIASSSEYYRRFNSAQDIIDFLPAIGTIAASATQASIAQQIQSI